MSVIINAARCKQCELCIGNCPKKAISLSGKINTLGYRYVQIDSSRCISCGICYTTCPDGVYQITADKE